jgi:hypothetical protein
VRTVSDANVSRAVVGAAAMPKPLVVIDSSSMAAHLDLRRIDPPATGLRPQP